MFGLGIWEIVILLTIALLVLGPEKLPSLARQLGRGVREFRRAATDLQRNFHDVSPEVPSIPASTDSKTTDPMATDSESND